MRKLAFSSFVAVLTVLASLIGPFPADGGAAQAQNRSRDNDERVVLVLRGVIGPGAYRDFRRAVRRSNPDVVILNGPGGVLGEALLIGEEVRRRGLTTLVRSNSACASACAVVFLSGRTKYMGRGALVGLHAASRLDGVADAEATNIMAGYLRGVGVPRSILRRMAATAPSDIRWLTRAEQRALQIREAN